jgi:hypothetical protein
LAGAILRGDIADEKRKRRERRARFWATDRHATILRFLQHHVPEAVLPVLECGMSFHEYESEDRPGWWKVVGHRCHVRPWCIPCVEDAHRERVRRMQDIFMRCTPKGKEPRFVHIVQTAPVYDDMTGWGVPASNDLRAFRRVVWRALERLFGKGIGARLSYQDWGEVPFRRFPHLDLTLNGWAVVDGEPVATPYYDLRNGGADRWDEVVVEEAQSLQIGAKRGSKDVSKVAVGMAAYYQAVSYQLREMLNLRWWRYDSLRRTMIYESYKEHRRVEIPVAAFMFHIQEYQARLGYWNHGQEKRLHVGMGHMADRAVPVTQKIMSGSPLACMDGCTCSRCGSWVRRSSAVP